MRSGVFLQGLISFVIVAFSLPNFVPLFSYITAVVGYALFWRCIRIYPFSMQRFWRSGLWYASICLIHLSWMSSIEYQGIYILFVWMALSIWLGVQFGLLSVLIPYNRPLTFARILAIASIWTLLEWSRFYVLCGYSWSLTGLALSNSMAIQLAAVFGILGLSFWVIFVNLLGLRALLRKGIVHYVIWAMAAVFPYFFGWVHTSYHQSHGQKPSNLSCLLVQTGLLPSEKNPLQGKIKSYISPYDQWKRILYLLKEQEGKKLDLIVFPEALVPYFNESYMYDEIRVKGIFTDLFGEVAEQNFPKMQFPYGSRAFFKVSNAFWVQSIANLFQSEMIIGLDHIDPEGKAHNSAFHIKPHESNPDIYHKRVLVPLAEYLPFRFLSPLVKSYGINGIFIPGKEAKVFQGRFPMSVSICYEETFPHIVREGRLNGAELLINVTNDGWFPFSHLPSLQYEHAKFRAVENGCALLRAGNTGVTSVIDSLGRCVDRLKEYDEKKNILTGALFVQFSPYSYSTLYMLWGNWGILSLSVLFLTIFLTLKKQFYW